MFQTIFSKTQLKIWDSSIENIQSPSFKIKKIYDETCNGTVQGKKLSLDNNAGIYLNQIDCYSFCKSVIFPRELCN